MARMRWRFGAYELDLALRELRVAGEPRPLQPQVFAVLAYLVRNRHRVVPKEEILRELWPDAIVTDASLQRAVSLARRAHAERPPEHQDDIEGTPPEGAVRYVDVAGADVTRGRVRRRVRRVRLDIRELAHEAVSLPRVGAQQPAI